MRLGLLAIILIAIPHPRGLAQRPSAPPPPRFDDAAVRAAGLRKLVGEHLTLYTDLPPGDAVDELPRVFDAAVPQWAKFFGVDNAALRDWRMQGYLMRDREPFRATGMLPPEREGVRSGYSIDHELWLSEQPTDYYRRHLLLHEGTHGFMNTQLGGCGPGWYMEGVAEMLGTHDWADGKLTLGVMPTSREAAPGLGRIRLINDAFAENRARPIAAILATDNARAVDNETYAWCWALAKFLDGHPRYHERFRDLRGRVRDTNFTESFRKAYADDWAELIQEWRLFVGTLAHRHDIDATAIDFTPGKPFADDDSMTFEVSAKRGWRNSGVRVEKGTPYKIEATGRFLVAGGPTPWPCEANGVTIEYYQGRPLGILLATVYENDAPTAGETGDEAYERSSAFLNPIVVGLGATWTPDRSGTLYFKINESPGRLHDNDGALRATITPLAPNKR